MIKAESLTRRYGDVVAVDDVSFQIEHGEIVGLLGHNGAGKTTIMKMLTGFLEPSSGSATINGQEIMSNRIAVQGSIGYLPENCPVYPDMIVVDYLDYASTLRGVESSKKTSRIRYAIEKTRLKEVALKRVNTLSRGYRQRLGVAQAILNSPEILILDEPTNGLDPSQIQEMRLLIKELAEKATVVISTHILQEVQAVCGRVIMINSGKLALDAPMKELRSSDRLSLTVDLSREKTEEVIRAIEGLSIVSERRVEELHQYSLKVQGADSHEVAPSVAKGIVSAGGQLFSLQPQIRDLETIFGEITAAGRLSAVAVTDGGGDEVKLPITDSDGSAAGSNGTTGDAVSKDEVSLDSDSEEGGADE